MDRHVLLSASDHFGNCKHTFVSWTRVPARYLCVYGARVLVYNCKLVTPFACLCVCASVRGSRSLIYAVAPACTSARASDRLPAHAQFARLHMLHAKAYDGAYPHMPTHTIACARQLAVARVSLRQHAPARASTRSSTRGSTRGSTRQPVSEQSLHQVAPACICRL